MKMPVFLICVDRYITVRLIVPAQTLFFQAYKVNQVAQRLLDILVQHNILHNPIIFHVFSNGGCMVYTRLTALLNSPDCEHQVSVRGVIFDSSPGKRRILNAVKETIVRERGRRNFRRKRREL